MGVMPTLVSLPLYETDDECMKQTPPVLVGSPCVVLWGGGRIQIIQKSSTSRVGLPHFRPFLSNSWRGTGKGTADEGGEQLGSSFTLTDCFTLCESLKCASVFVTLDAPEEYNGTHQFRMGNRIPLLKWL